MQKKTQTLTKLRNEKKIKKMFASPPDACVLYSKSAHGSISDHLEKKVISQKKTNCTLSCKNVGANFGGGRKVQIRSPFHKVQ